MNALPTSSDREPLDDLCRYLRGKVRELGLSYRVISSRAVDPRTGRRLPFQWIHKLARGQMSKAPHAWQLRALATGLGAQDDVIQALAARQWLGYGGVKAFIAAGDLALYLQWRDLPEEDKAVLRVLVEDFARRQRDQQPGPTPDGISYPLHLRVRDGDSEDARRVSVLALTRRADVLGWWHGYRDVVPGWFEIYLSLEPAASLIRSYETQFIPGLLQTEAYAEAVIQLGHGDAPTAQIRRHVELRMRRQQILRRPGSPRLWAIIEEAALRRAPISAAAMRAQIKHLIDVSERPNVALQVMPASAGGQAAGGPIAILRFPEPELPDVVYLEQLTGALYPGEPADIQHYSLAMNRVVVEAAEPAAATAILHRILNEI